MTSKIWIGRQAWALSPTLALATLTVLSVLTLGACTSTGSSSPAPSASGPGGAPSASAPAVDALVTFARTGGLAGVDDRLTVRADGSYTVTTKGGATRTGRLSADDVDRLRRVLDGAGLATVPAVSAVPTVADGYTYRISYAGHEVSTADGAVPEALRPVLDALDGVLGRTG